MTLRHKITYSFTKQLSKMESNNRPIDRKNLNILFFNWRDIKHEWAGGAELYIHEIARQWVKDGHNITIFCGNDGKNPRYETINGINIVRRGNPYTVYIWALIYYIFKLQKHTDVIIDCENGIPFFTPLYTAKPVILLIHHVHQEVFRVYLRFPFSYLAIFFELYLMPLIYRSNPIVAVSESTKKDIVKLGLGSSSSINVINPGIDAKLFKKSKKTKYPSFIYVGRLKPYKQTDVVLKAFARLVPFFPEARLSIVGDGESKKNLINLAKRLGIFQKVLFYGKVSNKEKVKLLGQSWVALQPSQMEGWGITVVEANACGTPVVASNVSGLRDSIVHGTTGVLVTAKDIGSFSNEMRKLVIDKKYRLFLSDRAYEWSQKFDWKDSAKNFHQKLTELLKTYEFKPLNIRIAVFKNSKLSSI